MHRPTDGFLEYVKLRLKELEAHVLEESDLADTEDVSRSIALHRSLSEMVIDYLGG